MFIKLIDGQPAAYSLAQLRKDNPTTSFPANISDEMLVQFDVYPAVVAPQPEVGSGEIALRKTFAELIDGVWTYGWYVEQVTATPEMVKMEAQRRILVILPEWKQRNLTARAAELAMIGQANWTEEEQAEWDAGQALWNQIKAIRVASDALEAMVPIPHDYQDDAYWG